MHATRENERRPTVPGCCRESPRRVVPGCPASLAAASPRASTAPRARNTGTRVAARGREPTRHGHDPRRLSAEKACRARRSSCGQDPYARSSGQYGAGRARGDAILPAPVSRCPGLSRIVPGLSIPRVPHQSRSRPSLRRARPVITAPLPNFARSASTAVSPFSARRSSSAKKSAPASTPSVKSDRPAPIRR